MNPIWRGGERTADRTELKTDLLTPGKKVKLIFPAALRAEFEAACGFTDEELEILDLLSRGFSATKTALEMQERTGGYYDRRTLERRIRAIKDKIAAIL